MSYLLGQMEATRIIGEAIHETGNKLVTQGGAEVFERGELLLLLGASFIRAADRMQAKMRDQVGEGSDVSR